MPVAHPRQNRVDPWGALVATPARGTLMGNRGCLHDDSGRIVRAYQGRRWIICRLAFKGRRRALMQPGHYTELFFLDEATALAAGHRPCAECQRPRFEQFRALWAAANCAVVAGGSPVPAPVLDAALHAERLAGRQRRTYTARLANLPAGTLVATPGQPAPWLVGSAHLWCWSFTGYTPGPAWEGAREVAVLTPPSIVNTLAAGYPVWVHPSAADPAFAGRAALDKN
jgi:hypothetical protein